MQVTIRTFTVLPTRSGVLRAVSERKILDLFSSRLAAISLSGYIFFGSSVSISDQVCPTHMLSSMHPAVYECVLTLEGMQSRSSVHSN